MKTLLRTALLAASLLVITAPAQAQSGGDAGFNLDADLGLAQFFGGGPTGFGVNLRPGYRLANGLALEVNLGYHTGSKGGVSQSLIPFLLGASYGFDVGSLRPFVGAHIGLAAVRVKIPVFEGLFGLSPSATSTQLAFNIGGGLDYMLSDMVGVGGSVYFWNIFGSYGGSGQMLNAGAHVIVKF